MSSSDKGLAALTFPPLMYGALAVIFGVVITSFLLGPSGMGQVQSAVMDILGLLDVIAGMDQAAIDSALATSYAMSCTSIMNQKMPADASAPNAHAGEPYVDAGNQVLAQERIHQYWDNRSATPIIGETCNASTTDSGVEFGPTNVTVTCDDFERGGGCDIHGFTLPQKNIRGGWVEWILGRGHPEHMLYYQALPSGVDESWSNLGERYNAMGVAIGAGISVVTPSIMKVGKALVKSGASGAIRNAASYMASGMRNTPSKARLIARRAGQATAAAQNPRAAARYAGSMLSNYLRSQGARAVKSWHRVFARDVTTYASAYARGSYDDITEEAIDDAVGAVSRELRETGYRNLDQAAVRSDIEEVLAREIGDDITDEGIEELSRIMARRWVGASRATAEEFAEQATQQRVARSATREGIQKLSYRQTEFQEQAFRKIGAFDRLLGQSSEEIMEDITSISLKGDIFESIFGKGIKTVRYVTNPARLKRNGIRTACSSNLFRAGMFDGAVSLMDSAEDIANEHDGVSQAYAEDMEELKEGDIESESGLNMAEGLGHCAAYAGLGAGEAAQQMCGRVGVSTPPNLGGSELNGAAACATITMAGITAEKMMSTRTPFMPQESNSLQLFNPVFGTMEFPLNRFANMHFMSIDKTDVGLMGQSKNRFYLISPVQTKNDSIRGNEPGKVEVDPGGVSQRLSGKQRAEKGDADPCNAVDGFKEFAKEHIEEAMVIGLAPVLGPVGLLGMFLTGNSLPNIVEGQDISVNRSYAINEYNAKGSFLQEGLCPNNVIYTDLPIVGKEVIMEDDYQYTDTIYQEQRQSLAQSNDRVTAPPGYKEAYPSAADGIFAVHNNLTMFDYIEGDPVYRWSSAMPMVQPIDLGMDTEDYRQVGDWLRTDELDEHEVAVKEVADVGAVFDLASAEITVLEAGAISFSFTIGGEVTVYYPCLSNGICSKEVDIDETISVSEPSNDLTISLDAIPAELPTPQLSVENATEVYSSDGQNLDNLNLSIDWEMTFDDFRSWIQDAIGISVGISEIDLSIDIPADFMFDDWFDFGIYIETVEGEEPSDDEYDGVVEFGGIIAFGKDPWCPLASGDDCTSSTDPSFDLRFEYSPNTQFDYFLNTGWIPRKYISQFGEGVDDYRPPPGLIGSTIDAIDSDRTLNYFVNGLDVTLDTGASGPYQDTEGNPLFGYDASDGEAGSMAIYLIGGVLEMVVMSIVGACTATVLGTAICYPLGGAVLAGIGGLTEMAAQTYKNGCNWPVHGCNRGLVESTIKGAQVAAGAAGQAAGVAVDAAVDAVDDPQAAASAVHSAAAGMLTASWDLGVSIVDFFTPSNETGEAELDTPPTYDGDAVEDPTDE